MSQAEQVIREPGGSGLTIDVAELLAEIGDADAAEAALSRIPLNDRFGDVMLRRLATGYARNGDLVRARQTIGRIHDADKAYGAQTGLAWLNVGRALAATGHRAEASEALGEALRSPEGRYPYADGAFLADVAEEQYLVGQADQAASTFKQATKIASSDPDQSLQQIGLSKIAAVQIKLGRIDSAYETAEHIRDPQYREYAQERIVEALVKAGRFDEAENASKSITRPWTVTLACFTLADGYTSAGRLSDARRSLTRAEDTMREMPSSDQIGVAFKLGQGYGALTDREAAAKWLDRAVALAEGSTIAQQGPLAAVERTPGSAARQGQLSGIAMAQARLGLIARARDTFEKAKAAARGEQPGMWQKTALWNIATRQAQAGLPDDAIGTMRSLPEPEPLVDIEIAKALVQADRLDDALQVVAYCNGSSAMRAMAEVLVAKGDLEKALSLARRFNGTEDVLRTIARRYAERDNLAPALDAVAGVPFPNARVSLLVGAAEGLLHRARTANASPVESPPEGNRSPAANR